MRRWGDSMKRHRDWAEIHFCVWRALRKCVKKRSGHRIFSEEKQKCREERRLWMKRRNEEAVVRALEYLWLRLGIVQNWALRQAQWPFWLCARLAQRLLPSVVNTSTSSGTELRLMRCSFEARTHGRTTVRPYNFWQATSDLRLATLGRSGAPEYCW